jgi:hypothetical protein
MIIPFLFLANIEKYNKCIINKLCGCANYSVCIIFILLCCTYSALLAASIILIREHYYYCFSHLRYLLIILLCYFYLSSPLIFCDLAKAYLYCVFISTLLYPSVKLASFSSIFIELANYLLPSSLFFIRLSRLTI